MTGKGGSGDPYVIFYLNVKKLKLFKENRIEPRPISIGAIGDAYGYCFEFAPQKFIRDNNDLCFHQNPRSTARPGVYSDDTQMHMALAEVIAAEREWTPLEIAQSFVDVFKRDPRKGYAPGFYSVLSEALDGKEFLARIRNDSEKNGAAMRASVIGLFPDVTNVISRSELQAKITHDTRLGVDSAVAASLLCHFFAYALGTIEEAPTFLKSHLPQYDWESPWKQEVPALGIPTVRAALTAIARSESLAQLLKECVSFTGDVDSVATIALASASGSYLYKNDIPQHLIDNLEDGNFGMRYLLDLDARVRKITIESSRGVAPPADS